MRLRAGGSGSPHPEALGGVGVGAGPGVAVGDGDGFGVAIGAGVATEILGIGTLRIGEVGVFEGSVGSSSVIVWHPTRTSAAATPKAVVLIATPLL
jgi:hypothetical protein